MVRIDHVTLAWSRLDPLIDAFEGVGLPLAYGGEHGNGVTHMSLLGFDDGSYIEVISTVEPGARSPLWPDQIAGDGGPAAWAILVDDVAGQAKRAIDAGLSIEGPVTMTRDRPDGHILEWDMGFIEGKGQTVPFVIGDRTPRDWRVTPTEAVAGGPLTGIGEVVIGVPPDKADRITTWFRRFLRYPQPVVEANEWFGARLESFPGHPVTLAVPTETEGWLADRITRYGASPCAFLIQTPDLGGVDDRYAIGETGRWFDRRTAWFDAAVLDRAVGVIELAGSGG